MDRKPVRAAIALTMLTITMVFLVAASGVAGATDDSAKAAVRELANEAKRDFDAGRFEEAKPKFQHAYAVARVPTLAVWTARASVKCGQLVSRRLRSNQRNPGSPTWPGCSPIRNGT